MKSSLYDRITKIHDRDIQGFIMAALDNSPDRFWTDPCSSSGKNHPPEDQGEGGVIRHTIKCVEISSELARFYDLSQEDKDIVIAATLMHDIQKNGIPWEDRTSPEHGRITYDWLDQFQLKQPEKDKIRTCVRYHMGRWSPKDELEDALNPTVNESIVQLSDYIGSRKCASFLPGIDISEKIIKSYE